MLKKIIFGILLISVLGAGGAALAYNANQEDSSTIPTTLESPFISSGNGNPEQDLPLDQPEAAQPQTATQVQTANKQVLALRGDTEQSMWSGGSTNGNRQNAALSDDDHIPQPMADVDAWLTLEGSLMSFQGGNMTMSTVAGEIIAFQTGQPGFFAEQGVTLQVGDEIIVLGFYEEGQFMAGEITQVSTGLRVMLRYPNGRPLWAGPGNGSTGDNGTQGIGNGTGSQGIGSGNNGTGRGTGSQGSGNGGRGNSGRGNTNS